MARDQSEIPNPEVKSKLADDHAKHNKARWAQHADTLPSLEPASLNLPQQEDRRTGEDKHGKGIGTILMHPESNLLVQYLGPFFKSGIRSPHNAANADTVESSPYRT